MPIKIEVSEDDIAHGRNPQQITYAQLEADEGYRCVPEKFANIAWLETEYRCEAGRHYHYHKGPLRKDKTHRTLATDEELEFLARKPGARRLTESERQQLEAVANSDVKCRGFGYYSKFTGYDWCAADGWLDFKIGGSSIVTQFFTHLTPAEVREFIKANTKSKKVWRQMSPIEVVACFNRRKREGESNFGRDTAEFVFSPSSNPQNGSPADFTAEADNYYTTLTETELIKKLGYKYEINDEGMGTWE